MMISDNGGEYVGDFTQTILNNHGIEHIKTSVEAQFQNAAEAQMCHVHAAVAKALQESKAPVVWWCFCFQHQMKMMRLHVPKDSNVVEISLKNHGICN